MQLLCAAFVVHVTTILGKGYESRDDWAAPSGFILFNAYLIFRPALGEIMDGMYDMIN
jgi:hypothetical protein